MVGVMLQIIGSLGLFLFGMRLMSDGLQKTAGPRLHRILHYMTSNRFVGVLTGFLITALIQSSSATTVMVVSFVNARLLSLIQATGVIMGANIGTTVTGWIVAVFGFKLKITNLALPAIGLGLPFYFIARLQRKSLGETLIGFGILFLGLSLLKESVPDIRRNPEALAFLSAFEWNGLPTFLLFVAVGTLITIIVQSSSAAMAITLTLAYSGWVDFNTAAAIVLGENIGTTVTAFIASLSAGTNARRASRVHTLFNVLGVVWMAFLFPIFIKMVDALVPGAASGQEGITTHLAMFHTMFNITNTVIFIWFVPQLTRLASLMVKESAETTLETYSFPYLSSSVQDTAELNIIKAQAEIEKMATTVDEMFRGFLQAIYAKNNREFRELDLDRYASMEDLTDRMQEELSDYLASCWRDGLSNKGYMSVNSLMRIVGELESIGDSCYNLMLITGRMADKKSRPTKEGLEELRSFVMAVHEFMEFNASHLQEGITSEDIERAYQLERTINEGRDSLRKSSRKRIQHGSDVRRELVFMDLVKHLEHIGDFSLNIAEALQAVTV